MNATPVSTTAVRVRVRHALQEEVVVADPAVAGTEHEREPERVEEDPAQRGVDDALDHDVRDLTGPGEAALEHHEARLHEEHEERGDEHPHVFKRLTTSVDLHRRGLCPAPRRRPGC